jgi:AraC family transcriptional regulator of adaptative response/methylated-DNA-[protein]-cysteine methyltransferase
MSRDLGPAGDDTRYGNDELRWRAVVSRDRAADDVFYYAVKSTGVYCRPSCAAKLARRENVRFFSSPSAAQRAGFRACKRCRPADPAVGPQQAAAVTKACRLIEASGDKSDLKTLARAVGLSPSHLHRVFKSCTGLTPKAYASSYRWQRVRDELWEGKTVTSAMHNAGFNSNSRFYAASGKSLGMTPTSFRAGGRGTVVRFAVGECWLGSILVAASRIGVCSIALGDDPSTMVRELEDRFPHAELIGGDRDFEVLVARVIGYVDRPAAGLDLPRDVQGTAFQQRVWQALCDIPCGQTITYSELAKLVGQSHAARAVARACAANRLAVAIPCHRVMRTDGSLSGYRWGVERKVKLLQRERESRPRLPSGTD